MVKMTCFRFNLDNPEHAKKLFSIIAKEDII